MANFPYIRIFPQKHTGRRCDYCNERHGVRQWIHPELPSLRFNSKKCMMAYVRDYNNRVEEERRRQQS